MLIIPGIIVLLPQRIFAISCKNNNDSVGEEVRKAIQVDTENLTTDIETMKKGNLVK